MPIKFRCIHCRQLLGISRGKAGQLVDCPTCGRTVRVPSLDGRIDPVAPPELNLRDEALIQALDALAVIGQLPPEEAEQEQESEPADADFAVVEETRAPQLSVEPPRPVALAPPLPAEAVPPRPSPLTPELNASAAMAELSWMANAGKPSLSTEPAATGHRRWTLALACVVGVSGLIIGFLAGWIAGRQATPSPVPAANVPEPPVNAPSPVPAAAPQAANLALRGRITYRGENGDSRPDAGARVIVLPQTRAGEVRLPAAGFRAGDVPVDFQVAQAALRTLGGDVAIVKEDGSYEISLASAGAYHVLVLSRFQPESEDSPMDAGLRNLLETWFARPDQVLGRVRHFLGQARYTGSDVQLWDHSFEPAA